MLGEVSDFSNKCSNILVDTFLYVSLTENVKMIKNGLVHNLKISSHEKFGR